MKGAYEMVLMVQEKKSLDAEIEVKHIGKMNGIDVYFVNNMVDLGGVRTGTCKLYVEEKEYGGSFDSPSDLKRRLKSASCIDRLEGYRRVEDENPSELTYLRLPHPEEMEKIKAFLESNRRS